MSKRFRQLSRVIDQSNYSPSGALGFLGGPAGTSAAVGIVGNMSANRSGRDTPEGQAVGLATGIGGPLLTGNYIGALIAFVAFDVAIFTSKTPPTIEQQIWKDYSAHAGQYSGAQYAPAYYETAYQGWWREKAVELD